MDTKRIGIIMDDLDDDLHQRKSHKLTTEY
jgi:hypothetical protein